jgi:hypothetical protein
VVKSHLFRFHNEGGNNMDRAQLESIRQYLKNHDRVYTVRPLTTYGVKVTETEDEDMARSAQKLINIWNSCHLNWRAALVREWLVLYPCRYLPKAKKFVSTPEGVDHHADFDNMDLDKLYDRASLVLSFDELASGINGIFGGDRHVAGTEEKIA